MFVFTNIYKLWIEFVFFKNAAGFSKSWIQQAVGGSRFQNQPVLVGDLFLLHQGSHLWTIKSSSV